MDITNQSWRFFWGKSDQIQIESIRRLCRQAQETKSEHGLQLEAQLEELRRLELEKASGTSDS